MATKLVRCQHCGIQNSGSENFCRNCGSPIGDYDYKAENQQMMYQAPPKIVGADKKVLAGVMGILLGGLGIHKFVLGYQREGVIMLSAQLIGLFLTIITCGLAFPIPMAVSIIGFIEGIIYLTKSDEEFEREYVINQRPWF